MDLFEKQKVFSVCVAKLILWLDSQGYQVTLGECWRTPAQAQLDADKGIGIVHSLHTKRLAIDLNLFKDGQWLTNTIDYKPAGEYWKSLNPVGCITCWGGDFADPDADHFSIEMNGVR